MKQSLSRDNRDKTNDYYIYILYPWEALLSDIPTGWTFVQKHNWIAVLLDGSHLIPAPWIFASGGSI